MSNDISDIFDQYMVASNWAENGGATSPVSPNQPAIHRVRSLSPCGSEHKETLRNVPDDSDDDSVADRVDRISRTVSPNPTKLKKPAPPVPRKSPRVQAAGRVQTAAVAAVAAQQAEKEAEKEAKIEKSAQAALAARGAAEAEAAVKAEVRSVETSESVHTTETIESVSSIGEPVPEPQEEPESQAAPAVPAVPAAAATASSSSKLVDMPTPKPQNSAQSWEDRGAAKIVTTLTSSSGETITKVTRKSIRDFKLDTELGEGSYSTVMLATDKTNERRYAIKVLDKKHIIREKKVKYVNIEKNALNRLNKGRGIVHLYYTFQDQASLYFVLQYAPNGELLGLVKQFGSLSLDATHYYGAQIIDAIDFMHQHGVVHRDIKPENILIDENNKVLITDFGTAKLLDKDDDGSFPVEVRANSFVGTAEYVSPELLNDKYCGMPADVWAFGCIIYQLIAGRPPFKGSNEYQTFQKVTKLQYAFSAGFPMVVRDLVKRILVTKPCDRLTVPEVKAHYWFRDVNWDDSTVWTTAPPEPCGPYKINAQAMMPIPALDSIPTKRDTRRSNRQNSGTSSSVRSPSTQSSAQFGGGNSSTVGSGIVRPPQSKRIASAPTMAPSSVAVAAAAHLTGGGSSSAATHSYTRTHTHNEKPHIQHRNTAPPNIQQKVEYIPGTKIPRPRLNTRVNTHTSSRTSAKSLKKKDVTAISPRNLPAPSVLDDQYSEYFVNKNERVIKAGIVDMSKYATADFEHRYKGMMAESPLGYRSKDLSITQEAGATGSLLDPVTFKEKIEEESPEPVRASSKLRNFFTKAAASSPESTLYNRVLVVTNYGRALYLDQSFDTKDSKSKYTLSAEVDLTNPKVHFVELIGERRRSSSSLQHGTFAIVSSTYTLANIVERQDIGQWTNALAKSRRTQQERLMRQMVEPQAEEEQEDVAFTAASLAAKKSPKIAASGGSADIPPLLQIGGATKSSSTENVRTKRGRRPPPPPARPQSPTLSSSVASPAVRTQSPAPDDSQMISAALGQVVSRAPASSGVGSDRSVSKINSRMLARARRR